MYWYFTTLLHYVQYPMWKNNVLIVIIIVYISTFFKEVRCKNGDKYGEEY